jgi:hypothetical protein
MTPQTVLRQQYFYCCYLVVLFSEGETELPGRTTTMNIPLIITEFRLKHADYSRLVPLDHLVVTVSASDGIRSIDSRLRGLGTHAVAEAIRGSLLDVGRAGTAGFVLADDDGHVEPIRWNAVWRS